MKAPFHLALMLLIPVSGTALPSRGDAAEPSQAQEAVNSPQPPAGPTLWSARLKGVVCAMCVQSIKKRIVIHEEVASIDIQLRTGVIRVEAKTGRVLDPLLLQEEIIRAGYDLAEIIPQL